MSTTTAASHSFSPVGFWLRSAILRPDRGLAASHLVRYTLKWKGAGFLSVLRLLGPELRGGRHDEPGQHPGGRRLAAAALPATTPPTQQDSTRTRPAPSPAVAPIPGRKRRPLCRDPSVRT